MNIVQDAIDSVIRCNRTDRGQRHIRDSYDPVRKKKPGVWKNVAMRNDRSAWFMGSDSDECAGADLTT